MIVVLDTNAYSDWRRFGLWNPLISRAEKVLIPSIVLGELRAGFLRGRQSGANEDGLARFLAQRCVEVGVVGEITSRHYAILKDHLRRSGKPIPEADVWIAAVAMEHAALLLTGDSHFKYLPQVSVGKRE